jgi:hypothetical protein
MVPIIACVVIFLWGAHNLQSRRRLKNRILNILSIVPNIGLSDLHETLGLDGWEITVEATDELVQELVDEKKFAPAQESVFHETTQKAA